MTINTSVHTPIKKHTKKETTKAIKVAHRSDLVTVKNIDNLLKNLDVDK